MRTNGRASIGAAVLGAIAASLMMLTRAIGDSSVKPAPESTAQPDAPAALTSATAPPPAPEGFATGETAKIEDLAWFAGCWMMALPDGVIEEHWLAPAGGAMLGLSRTVRGGKLKEYEFLALRELDGRLAYVAIPSRQRETAFPLVRFKKNAAVFENTAHDFPQRIIYLKTDAGITAMIEGKVKGAMRASEYTYRACSRPATQP